MTVAHALQRQLDKKNWTQQDAADALKTSRLTVNQLLNDRRGMTPDMALRLEKVFGVSAEKWMELQARQDLDDARRGYTVRQR
jgi:addiction module HigA family antidote